MEKKTRIAKRDWEKEMEKEKMGKRSPGLDKVGGLGKEEGAGELKGKQTMIGKRRGIGKRIGSRRIKGESRR